MWLILIVLALNPLNLADSSTAHGAVAPKLAAAAYRFVLAQRAAELVRAQPRLATHRHALLLPLI